MCVTVAAAASFLTPVATPANLMVMEPGGYRFGDYWKLGLPLLVLFGVVAVVPRPGLLVVLSRGRRVRGGSCRFPLRALIACRRALGALAVALALPSSASADLRDEPALAERYAPVVRLVEQTEECGPGEPYGRPTSTSSSASRPWRCAGPWNPTDLVKIGPTAEDLVGLYEYHLDFPGDALDPGCGYERWARRADDGTKPTVYAHVATDPGYPGSSRCSTGSSTRSTTSTTLHEGDWEMIQLVFDAADAREALARIPSRSATARTRAPSAPPGATTSSRSSTAPIRSSTRPPGSHANKFTAALYLGSSADAGVGCDDTRGPHVELRPVVQTIPSDPAAARARSRGSPSRAAGASFSRRSSTGRPGRI